MKLPLLLLQSNGGGEECREYLVNLFLVLSSGSEARTSARLRFVGAMTGVVMTGIAVTDAVADAVA